MANDNDTFADAMDSLKATLDCPSDNKLPMKDRWCYICREICDADGTNFCDRNFYLPNILDVEAAHNREIAAKDAENAKLCALVKELADALEPMICIESCDVCDAMVGGRMDACRDERARHNALIAKAREAVE